MGILFYYVVKRLTFTTVFITCGLAGFVWMAQSLRFIEMIVRHRVNLGDYFQLVLCLLPDLLAVLTPVGLALGALSTLRYLSLHHEWRAMQAMGLSPWVLYRPFLFVSILGAVLTFINGNELAPMAFRSLRAHELAIRSQWIPALSGSFQSAKDVTAYAQQQGHQGGLEHIFIDAPPYTFMARSGCILRQGEQIGCHLHTGHRLEHHPDGSVTHMEFDDVYYDFAVFAEHNKKLALQQQTIKPTERALSDLIFPHRDFPPNEQNKMKSEGHQRLLQTFLALLDVWIAFSLASAFWGGVLIAGIHLVVMAGLPFIVRVPWFVCLPYVAVVGVLAVGWFLLASRSSTREM